MKFLFVLLFSLATAASIAQETKFIDSLNLEICKTLGENRNLKHDIRLEIALKKHVFPYLDTLKDSLSQEAAAQKIFLRLEQNCDAISVVMDDMGIPEHEESLLLKTQPQSTLTKKQLAKFKSTKQFYFYEPSGEVILTISDGLWNEKFSDSTFSRLNYKLKDDVIELEFIESNKEQKKNLSNKGDKYYYRIYEFKDDIFYLYSFSQSNNAMFRFKLYLKQKPAN